MHLFIIVVSKSGPLNPEWAQTVLSNYESTLIPIRKPFVNQWTTQNGRIFVKSWTRQSPLYSSDDYFSVDEKNSVLHLFDGWIISGGSSPMSSLTDLRKDRLVNNEGNLGEFTYVRINKEGSGVIARNKSGLLPLYYAENSRVQILSNRASLAALIKNGSSRIDIDQIYQLSMLGVGWPLFGKTLFDGVTSVHPKSKLLLNKCQFRVSDEDHDILHDENLISQFSVNPKKYWDDLFDLLIESLRVFDFIDDKFPITFFLSGGKDSRLLLALLKKAQLLKRLDIVSTGAPYSHDVVVARQITSHFNLPHRFNDSIFRNVDYSQMLPGHLFLTEGRTGPFNMSGFNEKNDRIALAGHEIGLREDIVTKGFENVNMEEFLGLTREYFGGFDDAGVLKTEMKHHFDKLVTESFRKLIGTTPDIKDVPWRFRNESRCSGYLGFVKFMGEFQNGFAPYILMTDQVLSYAYNAGAEARTAELLHFEIMKRANPWLAYECPFGVQTWSSYVRDKYAQSGRSFSTPFPVLRTENAPSLGSFAVFNKNKEKIYDYLLSDPNSEIYDIVDFARVESLRDQNLNDRKLRIVWNLVMIKYLHTCPYFDKFSPFSQDQARPSLPQFAFDKSPVPTKDLYSNRAKINALLQKVGLADYYRDAMIELLWTVTYDKQGIQILRQANDARKQGNFEQAFFLYLAVAKLRNAEAIFAVGQCYFSGKGVTRNHKIATKYFKEAHDLGIAGATYQLGKCYDTGLGAEKSQWKALEYYQEAIQRGNLWPLERAGDIIKSCCPEKDYSSFWKRAADFYLKQAENNNAYCAYRLGLMLLEGKGLKTDKKAAIRWFKKASQTGFKEAKKILKQAI